MEPVEKTLKWFRVYAGAMAGLYGLYIIGGIVLFVMAPEWANRENPEPMLRLMGIVFAGIGVLFTAAHVATFFMPRAKWVWIYDLVMICLGMGSCCTLPFSIILLVLWIKPEVQAAYGMGSGPPSTWRPG